MSAIAELPPGVADGPSPRLLIINNMPSFYRTLPFETILDEYTRRTGGIGLVAYQVRRDSHGRGEWFFTPDSEFAHQPYFASGDTTSARGRTGYPLRVDWGLWRKFRPDHVFAAGWDSPLSLSAALYSRVGRAKMGVWVESNSTTSRHRGGLIDSARGLFLKSADFAVVPTPSSSAYVSALSGGRVPPVCLRNPVTLERLPDVIDSGPGRRLVFIGDLSERKGFDLFAAALAAGEGRGWQGVAFGRDLEGLAARVPGNLSVQPSSPLAQIVSQLRPTDILTIPSRIDPAPLTYSEALALGLRVLVSDRIAYGEDAEAGVGSACVNPFDAAEVIAAAEVLSDQPRPNAERGREVTPAHFADGVLGAFGL